MNVTMSAESERFVARLTVPARIESVRGAAAFLVDAARARQVPVVANPLFEVAIVEALNNALSHNPRDRETFLHCELELDGRCLRIRVLDEAAASPVQFAVPTAPAPEWDPAVARWDQIPEGGYGMYLIRSVFPDVRACSHEGRHGLEMALNF
jgi:anti-sigma regulatory factor (Ser/Thr protein kinase)